MTTFLITCWAILLRLCGLSTRIPAAVQPKKRKKNQARPPVLPSRRLQLSRVTGPRRALTVIADAAGQVAGTARQPRDLKDLEIAWLQLGDPVSDFVKSQIAIGETIPRFLESDDENMKLDELAIRARRSPVIYIQAILRGAPIGASLQATSSLADRTQRLFKGVVPTPVRTNGSAGECEWHVVDSMDRPVICRVIKHKDGRLEYLDGRGGFLHEDTLRLSSWRLAKGWIAVAGFGRIGLPDGDGDGLPNPELRPHLANPGV